MTQHNCRCFVKDFKDTEAASSNDVVLSTHAQNSNNKRASPREKMPYTVRNQRRLNSLTLAFHPMHPTLSIKEGSYQTLLMPGRSMFLLVAGPWSHFLQYRWNTCLSLRKLTIFLQPVANRIRRSAKCMSWIQYFNRQNSRTQHSLPTTTNPAT